MALKISEVRSETIVYLGRNQPRPKLVDICQIRCSSGSELSVCLLQFWIVADNIANLIKKYQLRVRQDAVENQQSSCVISSYGNFNIAMIVCI